jgi:hypothetical protein
MRKKPVNWLLVSVLVSVFATPVFAQEEGGGGGLPSSLFDASDFGARGDQAKPMDAIKKFFAQANVTVGSDQEKAMKPIVDAAFKEVQNTVERIGTPAGGQSPRGQGGGGERRGGRGGVTNPQLAAELQKINDEVLPKLVATLKPEQQATFKKWQSEQIKKSGGFASLKVTMEEAGAPLTGEQEPQIRALYAEDSQQRAQLQREAQGRPDPAKVAEIEKATLAKVARILTPEQRKALLDSRSKQ